MLFRPAPNIVAKKWAMAALHDVFLQRSRSTNFFRFNCIILLIAAELENTRKSFEIFHKKRFMI
jgi:hypothetical protein